MRFAWIMAVGMWIADVRAGMEDRLGGERREAKQKSSIRYYLRASSIWRSDPISPQDFRSVLKQAEKFPLWSRDD